MSDASDPSPVPFNWNAATLTRTGNLPHVRQPGVIYFVTFRLADSLPVEVTRAICAERDAWLALHTRPWTPEQEREYRRLWTIRLENLLDAGHGACELRSPACREIMIDILRHDDPGCYRLGDFVIMPNHVHALIQSGEGCDLADIIKAWKSISARRVLGLFGRRGRLWMDEYFDHAVRNETSYHKIVQYIRDNPRYLKQDEYSLGCGTLKIA